MPVAHLQEASTRMNLDDYRMDVQHCFVHKHICSTHINICNMWTSFLPFQQRYFFSSTCVCICAEVKVRPPSFHLFSYVSHQRCPMVDGGTCADEKVLQLLQHLIQELEIGRVTRMARRFFFDSGIIWWEACQIGNIGFWLILVYDMSEW